MVESLKLSEVDFMDAISPVATGKQPFGGDAETPR
jgi:hypothetical protein